jgi:hypothetical protein
MPVADDIRVIADRTNRDLDAVHDFFEYSKYVWDSFQTLVDQGHRAVATSVPTGNQIDQDGLLRLAPQYIREYLAVFTFRHFVTLFEAWLFDLLHRLLLHNPWQFAARQLDLEVVLKARDREAVISGVILKQLNELRYENLREWFTALNRAIRLDCPGDDEINRLAEVKATRDVLEHNAGVANETYVRRAGSQARYAAGEPIEIDDAYYLESWRLIKKVGGDVSTAAVLRLAPAAGP